MKHLLQAYGHEGKSASLGMVILEFAGLTDSINIFTKTCFILEGDSEIILRADELFKRLEHVIYDNYEWPSVNRVIDYALGLILKIRDTFLHQKYISSTNLDTAKRIVIGSNECLQGINNKKQKTTGVTPQRVIYGVNT